MTYTLGAMTDYDYFRQLEATSTPEEGFTLEAELGRDLWSQGYSLNLNAFMRQYLLNLNEDTERRRVLPFLPPTPQHIMFTLDNAYQMQAQIVWLRIYGRDSYYHDGQLFYKSLTYYGKLKFRSHDVNR